MLTVMGMVLAPVAGCSGTPHAATASPPPGLEAQFDAELELPLSDYSREILEDKKITGAEFQDADSRYVDCVNEAFPGRVEPAFRSGTVPGGAVNHSFEGTDADRALFDPIEPVCLREFMGDGAIDSLYFQTLTNPRGLPLPEVILACLVKKGLVDPDRYGVDQVEGDIAHDVNNELSDNDTELDFNAGEAFNCFAYQG